VFKLLDSNARQVLIELDGAEVSVPADISVAAALLYLDCLPLRHSAISGAARAPFCMMGICFECLIEVDGDRDQRACQLMVRPGMRLRRQLAPMEGARA
jgi:predicted molibdopterin-dependent oxidoreductase YjgC